MNNDYVSILSKELSLQPGQVRAAVELLDARTIK